MSGSLQAKVYGNNRGESSLLKQLGHYNAPVKRMGTYNSAPKRLGVYTGTGGSKNNLISEMYPHY